MCRYEYLRREGNFERSSGLQMGVDTIEVREDFIQAFFIENMYNTWGVWEQYFKVIVVHLKM